MPLSAQVELREKKAKNNAYVYSATLERKDRMVLDVTHSCPTRLKSSLHRTFLSRVATQLFVSTKVREQSASE